MMDHRVPPAGCRGHRAAGAEGRNRPLSGQDNVEQVVGQRIAIPRTMGVRASPVGHSAPYMHEKDEHPAAEQEHYPQKRQRLRLHGGRGVHPERWGENVANGGHHEERNPHRGEERLINRAVSFPSFHRRSARTSTLMPVNREEMKAITTMKICQET